MKILAILTGLLLSLSVSAATSQLKLDLLLAQRGDVSAQFSVATAYEYGGTDVTKDLKESFNWYMKAANQSHAPSQFKVGYFYENGLGVTKNIDTAMSWYKKAQANGSDQASQRLNKSDFEKNDKKAKDQRLALQEKIDKEESARKAEAEENARKTIKADKEKNLKQQRELAKKQATKTVKAVTPPKAETIKPKAVVNIPDIVNVVLNNKWKNQDGAADYLPSASTTCLESGDNELTCFSSEKSRSVKGTSVTYTAKSTLVGFKSNGSFKVIYNYNGINESGAKSSAADIYGLTMMKGWQEPAIAVQCQASDRKNISCSRGSKTVKFSL